MKWEDFINNQHKERNLMRPKTDIDCPVCGEKLYRDDTTVLTSYPPMHRYECDNCGWSGVA